MNKLNMLKRIITDRHNCIGDTYGLSKARCAYVMIISVVSIRKWIQNPCTSLQQNVSFLLVHVRRTCNIILQICIRIYTNPLYTSDPVPMLNVCNVKCMQHALNKNNLIDSHLVPLSLAWTNSVTSIVPEPSASITCQLNTWGPGLAMNNKFYDRNNHDRNKINEDTPNNMIVRKQNGFLTCK